MSNVSFKMIGEAHALFVNLYERRDFYKLNHITKAERVFELAKARFVRRSQKYYALDVSQ